MPWRGSCFGCKLVAAGLSGEPPPPYVVPAQDLQKHCVDGGGNPSTGDWRSPPPGATDFFSSLRPALEETIEKRGLVAKICGALVEKADESPLTEADLEALAAAVDTSLLQPAHPDRWTPPVDQPLALHALEDLAGLAHDPDQAIAPALIAKVPTGVVAPIPPSGIWRPLGPQEKEPLEFLQCQGNWSTADEDPQELNELIDKEIQAGWVKEVPAGTDLKATWGELVAINKIGVARVPGKKKPGFSWTLRCPT